MTPHAITSPQPTLRERHVQAKRAAVAADWGTR